MKLVSVGENLRFFLLKNGIFQKIELVNRNLDFEIRITVLLKER